MLSRRDVLRAGAALSGVAAARALVPAGAGATFAHGVASGDPVADRVVIWTRVSGVAGDIATRWTVARDEALADVVATGDAQAGPDGDHTVHVDVDGLEPATTYHFGFVAAGVPSPVGRTRTAAAAGDGRELRLGVVSCSSFANGPFTVYRHLAGIDVDLVVHLGDYLYDVGNGFRSHVPPSAPTTLDDYRRRHAQQRSDADLQRLHAATPVAAVWDDHDVAGNAWRDGAAAHDPEEHGDWGARRAAALRAWLEWLPVRRPDPARPERIWRRLDLGVADLVLLDTRHDGRDRQLTTDDGDVGALGDPSRSLLSEDQRRWVADSLASSTAPWRLLGSQVVLTPLGFEVPALLADASSGLGLTVGGKVINPDAWDGYPAERQRLLASVAAAGPTVVLSGDVHSSWAFDVPGDGGAPVAVEWVTPSVTAPPFAQVVGLPAPSLSAQVVDLLAERLPQVRWAELTRHGYLVVAITAEQAQADWWHVDLDTGEQVLAASWSVAATEPSLREAVALPPRAEPTKTQSGSAPPPARPGPGTAEGGGTTSVAGPLAGLGAAGAALAVAAVVAVRRRRRRP